VQISPPLRPVSLAAGLTLVAGCASAAHTVVAVKTPAAAGCACAGAKSALTVGKFDTHSSRRSWRFAVRADGT
jgi:hypothetical protein